MNTCLVNGRVSPLTDSYTTVSHRGKYVVDYVITRHEDISKIEHFEVISMSDFIAKHNLTIGVCNTVSDHSIIACSINTGGNY